MSACTVDLGGHPCGRTERVRHYLTGYACPAHTPARVAGRPEAYVDPALTLEALQAPFANRPVTPDTRPRMGRFGVEVERARLKGDIGGKEIRANVRPPAPGLNSRGQVSALLECPGCHRHPGAHEPNCPLGPRARFAMAADGSLVGTAKRGPE